MALSTLLPLVALDVANAPRFLVIQMLRLSAQEFCRESDYWQETDSFPVDGSKQYTISYSSRLLPCRIISVKHDDNKLKPQVDFVEVERGLIEISNPPSSGTLSVITSVQPANDNSDLTDELVDYYQQGIVAGAVARLLRMPDKPWSNPREVSRHEDIFSTQHRAARRERLDKNSRYTKKKRRHTFY